MLGDVVDGKSEIRNLNRNVRCASYWEQKFETRHLVSYKLRIWIMQHSPGFLKVVNEARAHIKEVSVAEARARVDANPKVILVDIREDSEWAGGHATQAMHLGKGILERDIEVKIPDKNAEIILYCGGGYRSALSAEMAQRMGYTNVASMMGGYKGMVAAGWPMTK